VVWLCGPPGVGKTAVAWEIYNRLLGAERAPAYADVDQLGMCYPEHASDPARHRLKARNVGVLRANYAAAGARGLVVSGVVDGRRGPDTDNVGGGDITVCRLRVDRAELLARLRGRHGSFAHPDAAGLEADLLDHSTFADWCVDTTGLRVDEVADRVLARIGEWPNPNPESDRDAWLTDEVDGQTGPAEGLWLCGPSGVGKSTIGFSVYLRVLSYGVPTAYVDVDQVGFCGIRSSDHRLRARNLAALWRNFHAVGAEALVVVGPVATVSDTSGYEASLPEVALTWCRLHADEPELTGRILSRRDGGSWPQPGDPLKDRSPEELLEVAKLAVVDGQRLEAHNLGLRIDVGGLEVKAAADKILTRTGWPAMRS
jgi:adenylylsulfate kinase-like enzyme